MNIKRFIAPNSREALRQVREAIGGDAVILSNRRVGNNVEVLAAASEELLSSAAPALPKGANKDINFVPTAKSQNSQGLPPGVELITGAQAARAKKRIVQMEQTDAQKLPNVEQVSEVVTPQQEQTNPSLAEEIRSMRGFIEEQLASLAWSESMRRQPTRMKIMQDLLMAGFSPALSRYLQQNLPDDFSMPQARDWISGVLEKNLLCVGSGDDLVDRGGVYALVGPTGVGKTTTTAKLAARFAVKYGAEKLALITTDGYRIGAQDQLRIYGKILGVPVYTIQDEASLAVAIQHLSQKSLVLIDTAGMGQRDQRVAEQIAMLKGAKAKRLLVLNATVQAETLEDVIAAYGDKEFNGCVISKLDEAVRFGGVLDVVIRHHLRIHYVASGQRVPEDLHRPNARYLIHRALKEAEPNKAFALQEDDYPVWLDAIAKRAKAQADEDKHV